LLLTRVYHGNNDTQEFWESEDHSLLLLRLKSERGWSAHRNYMFKSFADSSEEAARLLDAELCHTHVWKRFGDTFELLPV
jgi:hypothetical protein